jgi:hypothetical protein
MVTTLERVVGRLLVVAIAFCMLTTANGAAQTLDLKALGPRIGEKAQDFRGIDQFGHEQTLQSLIARDGLMLVFFRSADW